MSSLDPHQRFEVRAPTTGPVCPICMVVQNERVRYAFWFFAEAANEPETIGALRASRCFCAEHTRLVLADERSTKVLPRLVLECLVAVGVDLESAFTTAPSPCPACASEVLVARRALKALCDELDTQAGRSATTDPLCPKHLRAFLLSADRRSALRLARRGASHFRSTGRVQTVLRLAIGADPDRLYRADMRKQIDPDLLNQPRSAGVLERLLSDLKVCSCPACLAGTRAEFRYLEWVRAEDDERVLAEEVAPLCPPHLNDVALVAPHVAAADRGGDSEPHDCRSRYSRCPPLRAAFAFSAQSPALDPSPAARQHQTIPDRGRPRSRVRAARRRPDAIGT